MELWVIALALGVAIVLVIVLMLMSRGDQENLREEIYQQVKKCEELARGDAPSKRDAVIRLDTQLGRGLKYAGVKGETVGERLKNAGNLFDRETYNHIWEAHKLRNRLVHENYDLSGREAESAVKYFKIAIRRLVK